MSVNKKKIALFFQTTDFQEVYATSQTVIQGKITFIQTIISFTARKAN